MEPKKKLREYLTRGVRKIKHRKGFGVHSPFAYSVITEVIEEKVPYYAYSTLKKHYDATSPIPLKMAQLLLRLSNRFSCRHILELRSDGGYTALPLLLVDSRNEVLALADEGHFSATQGYLRRVEAQRRGTLRRLEALEDLPEDYKADMIIINMQPEGWSDEGYFARILALSTPNTVFVVKGITPGRPLEGLWDYFCDCDDVEITMDLYDYGLAIRKPRFFKQHYVVSF